MPLDFIRRIAGLKEGVAAAPEDARAAIAAVLVMAARSDDDYAAAEQAIIDDVLARRYGIDPAAARALREQGEEAEAAAIDLYQFTRAIKQAVPHEDRYSILQAMWRVVLADSSRDPLEDALMRQLTDRLGLSPMDSAKARQSVQG